MSETPLNIKVCEITFFPKAKHLEVFQTLYFKKPDFFEIFKKYFSPKRTMSNDFVLGTNFKLAGFFITRQETRHFH